jgi:hypothetical protein
MTFTMISPAEWERMPWHAREKFLRRVRKAQANLHTEPEPVQESVQPKPVRVRVRPTFRQAEKNITRCGSCGAWMITECKTDHGRRYEP